MNRRERIMREAPFALRVVQRQDGRAAIVYRRQGDAQGRDRLQRLGAIAPLALTAATPFLREAIARSRVAGEPQEAAPAPRGEFAELTTGSFHPLDADWGARVACFALIAAGLRDGERLLRAADHLRHADPVEAAWWLGMLTHADNARALRALRILTEAVQ